MPGVFADSPGKRIVREQWDTPLLRYLHDEWKVNFRYMGLPGVDIIDLKLWADMIEEVIAFELPDRRGDPRRSILQLRTNLRLLGKRSVAYYGPFEEVVILARDYDGTDYRQENVVTLYNLDFCDEIGSRIKTREHGRVVWRFEALRHVLQDQKECYEKEQGPSWFVLLLTVRNQINADSLSDSLDENLYAETKAYCEACEPNAAIPAMGSLTGTHTWGLKAFIHNTLRSYLATPHISALFFPLVKYVGRTASSPMLHWVVFCRFDDPQRPSPHLYPSSFLADVSSLRAEPSAGIRVERELGESGRWEPTSSQQWFQSYERYVK